MKHDNAAVMAGRHEPAASLDFFPTPPWASRALVEKVLWPQGVKTARAAAWDPACGAGHMAGPLNEYFGLVHCSDIFDYGCGHVLDFLQVDQEAMDDVDWIITNPPFNQAENFIHHAMALAGDGVAMLVRVQFLESVGRFERLFRRHPPTIIAYFAERVPMHRGRWVINGSTATAYCWLVWLRGKKARAPLWIPPCRKQLTAPGDWLEYDGVMDVPKNHAAMRGQRNDA